MPMNLDSNPWYDDFDSSKNYYKILFKPGYAIQARELTQLQTAVQKQISSFGSHIFKDGSLVLNGSTNVTDVKWMDVTGVVGSISTYVGATLTGETTGSIGKVFSVRQVDESTSRVYFNYFSGAVFQASETILVDGADAFVVDTAFGVGRAFSVDESIFYTKGYFVHCPKQSIIIAEDTTPITIKVGLAVTESVITATTDESLLDPAQGSYNYAAPGADRYSIALTLTTVPYTPSDQAQDNIGDFIELSRFEEDVLVYKVTSASYADLETTMARRTYDESGDYTVRAFGLKVKPHVFGDSNKLTLAVEPGKAYVKGYEFETIATTNVSIDKALDTEIKSDNRIQIDFGNYFVVSSPSGTVALDFSANPQVNIKNGGTVIGTAVLRAPAYHASGQWRLYAADIALNAGQSMTSATALANAAGTWTATLVGDKFAAGYSRANLIQLPHSPIAAVTNTTMIPGAAAVYTTNAVMIADVTVASDGGNLYAPLTVNGGDTLFGSSEEDFVVINKTTGRVGVFVPTVSFNVSTNRIYLGTGTVGVIQNGDTVRVCYLASVTNKTRTKTLHTNGVITKTMSLFYVTSVSYTPTGSSGKVLSFSNVTGIKVGQYVTGTNIAADSFVVALDTTAKTVTLNNAISGSVTTAVAFKEPTETISLEKYDCYKIISAITTSLVDITNYVVFNNGQKDDLYDYGSVTLKREAFNLIKPSENITVTFSYFTHSSGNGILTVDSYSANDIGNDYPKYMSSSGITYDLRNCIDFRPYRDNTSGDVVGAYSPVYLDAMTVDYSFYKGRIDKLVLTKERKFSVVRGVSSEFPTVPNDLYDAMTLYVVNVPAGNVTAQDVSFSYIDNRRYTMRDIGKIDKRVSRMEYYTALSLLEKQAVDKKEYDSLGNERFKNGVLVDSFNGHAVGDVSNLDYSCAIDPENGILRPRFSSQAFKYKLSSVATNLTLRGDLLTLPYTSTNVLMEQPYASTSVNLNPYMVFMWNGTMDLSPATDTWVDTVTKPDVTVNMNGENDAYSVLTDNVSNPASVGVRWNDWQTVNRGVQVSDNLSSNTVVSTSNVNGQVLQTAATTITNNQTTTTTDIINRTGLAISTSTTMTNTRDLGARVVDTSIVPYIRPQVVKFAARNMKPMTRLIALFDGVEVTRYCSAAHQAKFTATNTAATKLKLVNGSTTKIASIILVKSDTVFFSMDSSNTLFTDAELRDTDTTITWGVETSPGTFTYSVVANSSYVVESLDGIYPSGEEAAYLMTNEKGDVAGYFYIPNNDLIRFRTGERAFRLTDSYGGGTTAAETKYVAQGMSQSVERTLIATRVNTVSINPVSNTETVSNTTTNIIVTNSSVVTDVTPTPAPPPPPLTMSCGQAESSSGRTGRFTYVLDFGSTVGNLGIVYSTSSVPDRYTIIWDGKEYSTGFKGDSSYDTTLNGLGYPSTVGTISDSTDRLTFQKSAAEPSTAILVVDAPLPGSNWNFTVDCTGAVVPAAPVELKAASLSLENTPTVGYMWVQDFRAGEVLVSRPFLSVAVSWTGNVLAANKKFKIQNVTITKAGGGSVALSALNVDTTTVIGMDTPLKFNLQANTGLKTNTDFTVTAQLQNVDSPTDTITATATATFVLYEPIFNIDPVAQTFFIDANLYPNGVFVDSVDLFFKRKSTAMPVQVQIRSVINGYPSSSVILPFATAQRDAADVMTSTDGTEATNFRFQNIVHLAPGEYAFVVMTNTDEYEIYTARIGDFSITDTMNQKRITTQPATGSMFKSQNASTWTPVQEEDIKFKLYSCKFSTSGTTKAVLNTDVDTQNGDVLYDTFYAMGETVDFAATSIGWEYSTVLDGSFADYQLGSNVALAARTTLSHTNGATQRLRVSLHTSDENITPVVDLNRLSSTLVRNLVDYPTDVSTELNPSNGVALSKYITRKVQLAPGLEASDLAVYFSGNIPSSAAVKVYYKVAVPTDSFFDDNNYVEMQVVPTTSYSENSFIEYKYKTSTGQALTTGEDFNVFAVKIVMLSSNTTQVPQIKDLRVLALS